MHGAATSLAAAGLLAEELGHDRLGVGTTLDGMDMIAVAGDDIVLTGARRFQHTVGTGLLAGIQMQETADLALHIGLMAALLEAAGKEHLAQQTLLVRHTQRAALGAFSALWKLGDAAHWLVSCWKDPAKSLLLISFYEDFLVILVFSRICQFIQEGSP